MATRKKIPLIDASANLAVTGDVTITGSGTAVITFPSVTSTLATLAGTETLTNKTISGASNTLTNVSIASVTGTKAQFDTAVTDGNIMYVGDAPTSHNHVAADITDFSSAVAATAAVTANTAKVTNATHTGDVTGSGALTIAADAVTFAKMQNIATNKLLGRATASTGDIEEITLGTNLSFTGTTLNAASGSGTTVFYGTGIPDNGIGIDDNLYIDTIGYSLYIKKSSVWLWVGEALLSGGTTGQVLSKVDGTDYNVEWVDPGAGGGVSESLAIAYAIAL